MSNLTKSNSNIVKSDTTSGAVGKGLILGGVGAGGLYLLAGLLPFVSFPFLILAMIVIGLFMAE